MILAALRTRGLFRGGRVAAVPLRIGSSGGPMSVYWVRMRSPGHSYALRDQWVTTPALQCSHETARAADSE